MSSISPLAIASLFAPVERVQTLIPAPLHLLEFVPGNLAHFYRKKADGTLARTSDHLYERHHRYPDGTEVRTAAVGDPRIGLPTLHDYDYLFALLRIHEEGGVDEEGRVLDPSYRAVLRAAGKSDDDKDAFPACRRAFGRWGGTRIHTRLDLDYLHRLEEVKRGGHANAPSGQPLLLENERYYGVLDFNVSRYLRGDTKYSVIAELKINAVWLGQMASGISAWVDIDRYLSLGSSTAKAVYQKLALRAARGEREALMIELQDLMVLIGKARGKRAANDKDDISAALEMLAMQGILGDYNVESPKRGQYHFTLTPGRVIAASSHLRGLGARDPLLTRVLVHHLGEFRIAADRARVLLRQDPLAVVTALRRAYYNRSQGKRITSGWIIDAVEKGWSWDDPPFRLWLRQMEEIALGQTALPLTISAPPETGEPLETSTGTLAELEFADDAWGAALRILHGRIRPEQFRAWLQPSWLEQINGDTVTICHPNSLAPQWLTKSRHEIAAALGEVLERDPEGLQVHFRHADAEPLS